MKDLTKGKISTLILGFAIPVFLGNLLQLTYSLADTRIVGSFLGERSLAAVGATTTISNLIVGFLLGLANGFAIITAQKFGAGDMKSVRKTDSNVLSYYAKGYYGYCKKLPERCQDYKGSKKRTYSI
jgi:Na+-driven multidrug efflux pump